MFSKQMSKVGGLITALILAVVPLGCSSGGGDSGGGDGGGSATGTLNLSVTDAPVDDAARVVIQFTGVELHAASGERLSFAYTPPRQIDLLALNGGESALLLDAEKVPAGHYTWLRLEVAADTSTESFIELLDGSIHPLRIPSGDQTGLKLVRGFDVPVGGLADFTIDFDLRKSVHFPPGLGGDYLLRPTLRLVDNTQVGSIAGVVAAALRSAPTCSESAAVYVFAGHDVVPDDVDGVAAEPITTALVELDGQYRAAFLSAGAYTVAFTCQAGDDAPNTDDDLTFVGTANVTVAAHTQTTLHFP